MKTANCLKKYDWKVIEQDYVVSQEEPTLRTLEQKYGCSHATLQRHSSKGGWLEKRKQHWAKVSTNAAQKAVESQSERLYRHIDQVKLAQETVLTMIRAGRMRVSPRDLANLILLERQLYGETEYSIAAQREAEQHFTQEEAAAVCKALAEVRFRKELQPES